jgi:hypothetical protein
MLRVRHCIPDDILQKDLQHASSLLVDEPADALHATPPSQAPDGRLGDPLDVVAQHLPVTLGATLAQSLASLAAPRHGYLPQHWQINGATHQSEERGTVFREATHNRAEEMEMAEAKRMRKVAVAGLIS